MDGINQSLNETSDSSELNTKSTPATVIPGETRRVAVLSMNIRGFENPTVIVEEDSLKRIMTLITDELSSCITAFGGEHTKTDQNRIVGMFGASHATERSCQRAIDCGFRMLKSIEMIGKSMDSENQHLNFCGSAGIAWGSAIVTPDSAGGISVHGDCVDLSSALGKAAPQGKILVSNNAMTSSAGFFTWESFADHEKWKTWIPVKKKDSPPVHPLLYEIPLLGRDKEIEHLTAAFSSYLRWFNHPAMFISGKPGSGKSCLIEHFLSKIPGEDARVIRLKNKLWDQPPLGTWLPLMKKGTFDPYGKVIAEIRRLRSEENLILVIEDLHWADAASLKLLDQLSRTFTDAGIFLIVTSRDNPQGYLLESSEKLAIEGLDEKSIIKLLKSILGAPEGAEDQRFADFLMESTGGNPLLLTELVVHAVETGIIGRNLNNTWFLDEKLDHVVSDTAESFLQARLSILKPDEKFALQVAAVLGNGFQENLFSEVFSSLGKKSARLLLSRLLNMGFLTTHQDESFHFLNSLIAETVYNTILKGNREIIHLKAAEVLSADLNPEAKKALSITLSRHWIESESGEEAVPWLLSAMQQCLDVADVNRAENLSLEIHKRISNDSEYSIKSGYLDMRLHILMGKFQLALETAEKIKTSFEGRLLAIIFHSMAKARENLGMPLKDVLKDYILGVETAELAGDKNTAANCLGAAGAVHLALGRRKEALSTLNRALEYEDSLDTMAQAVLHGNMGILMQRTGSLADALSHYSKAYELGKKCGNMNVVANSLAYMGHVEIDMGKKDEGIKKYREALAIHRIAGSRRGECIILGNLGGALARFGEAQNAIEALKRAIHIAEEIGHTRGVMTFHANIGLAYKLTGQYDKAEKHIRESMEMIERTGDKRALAVCHLNLSGVLSKLWKTQEAIDEARRSLRFACSVNALTTQARALGNLGSLMLKTDRPRIALNFFKEAYKRSSLAEDLSSLAGHLIGESKCLLELGLHDEALAKFDEVMSLKGKYNMDFEGDIELKELEELLGIRNE
ncbi:MAG: tetratricopeptide repeat protein [Candidatus Sabulitectum sp.]|nr:tetratricopeptide repeat protein [Candidatus Sabulitectum sp.]